MAAVLLRALLVMGLLTALGLAEEPAWRIAARGLPANLDAFLAAARVADLSVQDERAVHRLLALAYFDLRRFDDAFRHAESALALTPPALDASAAELELRRLCSDAALRAGRIERSESHAVRLAFSVDLRKPGRRIALATALDRLMEASIWRGALSEANGVGEAIWKMPIDKGKVSLALKPLIRYAALLVDVGQFVPALRILDEVDGRLPDEGADMEHGLSMLARARASRRMGNPKGAANQMREARKFIQLLDDHELYARLAMEEVLMRIESDPPQLAGAAKWIESYFRRRQADMTPDKIWDRRLWAMLGVVRDFSGDREGAVEAFKQGIVGHEQEGPLSMTETRAFLSCATYLHEDRNDKDALAIARRADMFMAQFAQSPHGRAGLSYAAEVQRRIAQSMRDEQAASDFAERDASGEVLAKEHVAAAAKAEKEKRMDDAEQLYLRAFRCAPWSLIGTRKLLWFLLRTRRQDATVRACDAARVAGHSDLALFTGGVVALGAHDEHGAIAMLGRLMITAERAPRSPRFPLGLGAMLAHEPGVALRVLTGDPGWGGAEWETEQVRRALALKWIAKAYLSLGYPEKARRQLRRKEAAGLSLAGVQEIEWEAAYLEGKPEAAVRHVRLLTDRAEQKGEKPPHIFRAVLQMEQGKWAAALADWETVLDEKSDGVFVVAAWVRGALAGAIARTQDALGAVCLRRDRRAGDAARARERFARRGDEHGVGLLRSRRRANRCRRQGGRRRMPAPGGSPCARRCGRPRRREASAYEVDPARGIRA